MNFGFTGKILKINLNDKSISVIETENKVMRKYMGGKGLIGYFMMNEMEKDTYNMKLVNNLYIMTGVMSGIPHAGTSRLMVGAISPITGGFGMSESGGFFSAELKKAGWDGIILEGQSKDPVYIYIKDDNVEIKDASHIWGKGIGESNQLIKDEIKDKTVRMSQIGPAGENEVQYASIINDLKHACGRNGMGAVMGSKKVKAIAVKGTRGIDFYNLDNLRGISKWYSSYYKEKPLTYGLYLYGTAASVMSNHKAGMLPTRNFSEGTFEGAEKISGETMAETILKKREGCYSCPIRCKRVVEVNNEKLTVDPKFGGPEYETIGSMGSMCGIDNLEIIAKTHEICNDMGIDTISTGVSISFAMECYEKGIINISHTDGIELNFGNEDSLLSMINKIVYKDGIGRILAKGVKFAAEVFGNGSEAFAMHVKGQELAMHDPRGKVGVALGYSVSPTGADHMQAGHDTLLTNTGENISNVNILGISQPLSPIEYGKSKAEMYSILEKWWSFLNMAGVCDFVPVPRGSLSVEKLLELLNSATGWDVSVEEAVEAGERGINLARHINYRLGVNELNEELPKRLYEPLTKGKLEGTSIDKEKFNNMKKEYYKIMGWDSNGQPLKETLHKLGI
ncbi:aldehyde ferredoxin oxidoreductase family protein [Sedimentibacter sp.]|uniref:aldehyde ferredoxin oxidoreductase family protein n=1 Tax=Sedimentibacter sp. TaxID=1960295 RepID=UPI0028AF8436|nr:aldehyde ferredoxin oxidoreductase family protein [Sedimentibacter sp.]